MTDLKLDEIQSRMASLKAELEGLSLQLSLATGDVHSDVAGVCLEPSSATRSKPNAATVAAKHERSVRTLRNLMWQGRWSLAFHLAQALAAQQVSGIDFEVTTIRAWVLASQAERRSHVEGQRLVQSLLDTPEPSEVTLGQRIFKWATLIGLMRSVEPSQVRGFADRFAVPSQLPATSAWWNQYIEALATASRSPARWIANPEENEAASEINDLMLHGSDEPVRLAASCLMMSIRRAMRLVQLVSPAGERLILNAELQRGTPVRFTESGETSSTAAEIEQAVCELAAAEPLGRTVTMTTGPLASMDEASSMPSTCRDAAAESLESESAEAPVVENALGLSSIDAADDSLRAARRAAARARLERYADWLAIHGSSRLHPTAPATPVARDIIPMHRAHAVTQASAVITLPDAPALPEVKSPLPIEASSSLPREVRPAGQRPALEPTHGRSERGLDERRGIHEASVATAFAADNWNGLQGASANLRPSHRSGWNALFSPQSAIVAGLLVIAGAVIAGLGTGLAAKGGVDASKPAALRQDEPSTPQDVGDFPTVE